MDRKNLYYLDDFRPLQRLKKIVEQKSDSAHPPPSELSDPPTFNLDDSIIEDTPATKLPTNEVCKAELIPNRHTLQQRLAQNPFAVRIFFSVLAVVLTSSFWLVWYILHAKIPAVTRIFWKSWYFIFLPLPLSRLWDIPASFLWGYVLIYCFQRYVRSPQTFYLFFENVVLFFLVGIYVVRSFGLAPTFVASCACAVVIALNLRVLLRGHLGAELAWDLFLAILLATAAGFGLGVGVAHVGLVLGFFNSLAFLSIIAVCAFTFVVIRECILLF